MRNLAFLSLLFVLCAIHSAKAQDRIILLNSKEITGIKVLDITANTISYQKTQVQSLKAKKMYRDNIFGIVYQDGKEKVLYLPDPADDGDYTIEQMRMFIKGTKDSREHYHHVLSCLVGFAGGFAGPIYISSPLPSLPPLIALPPALGIFLASMGSPNMKHQKVDPKYLFNEEYLMGFTHRARQKKIRNAFFFSIAGIVAGVVAVNNMP